MKILGLVEKITVHGKKHSRTVLARIDTGAQSNSIDLELAKTLHVGPAERTTVVKSAHGSSVRPVVMLDIDIAGARQRGRFTIADRSKLRYPVLIGRNILKIGYMIDTTKNESCIDKPGKH
jgi:hypothetical protein